MVPSTLSEEALRNATSRSWEEWLTLLRQRGAEGLSHKDIARWLVEEHRVDGWWAQSITVEFERAIGRRAVGQTARGDFQVSVTRTLAMGKGEAFKAWQRQIGRTRNFDGVAFAGEPASSRTDKRQYWRVTLANGSKVTAIAGDKGKDSALLTVAHERLAKAAEMQRWKAYWKAFLADM